MRISGFSTTRPNMPTTRTYGDFMKFLGEFMTHNNKKIAPRINFVNCWKPPKDLWVISSQAHVGKVQRLTHYRQ